MSWQNYGVWTAVRFADCFGVYPASSPSTGQKKCANVVTARCGFQNQSQNGSTKSTYPREGGIRLTNLAKAETETSKLSSLWRHGCNVRTGMAPLGASSTRR